MASRPVAIVTAASRGMGAACARELASRDYGLVLLARSNGVAGLAEELGGVAVMGSVTDPAALRRTVDAALQRYGRLDGVVNNTGHPEKGPLLEIPDAAWHQGLDLLLLNVVRMARLVAPIMAGQGGGSMVNISTFGAREPSAAYPVSSALRAGLSAFTRLFAREYGPRNVRMNTVLPGFIDSHEIDERTRAEIPLGRAGRMDEVARTVAFLISPESGYITGENLRIDGGMSRSV